MENYEKLLERVSRTSGVNKEELERKVEAKRAKLANMISKEGAAQIIAAELGVVFDNERMKLLELVHGMKRVNVVAQIVKMFPVREFNKNGREGKVANMMIGDDSSNTRLVLWDINHIGLIEKGELKEGDFVEIGNGSVRNGEVHLSAFSDIKKSSEKIDNVKTEAVVSKGDLKNARPGNKVKVRALIVQSFEPKFFTKEGETEQRALLNIVLDDGTETMRCVLFGEVIEKLGLTKEDINSAERFKEKKMEFLGEEMIFSGSFRKNTYFNNIEMSIDNVEKMNVDSLIKELEAKV